MPSVKNIGKPYAGKPHVRFDEGGQVRACSLLYPEFDPGVAELHRRLLLPECENSREAPFQPDEEAGFAQCGHADRLCNREGTDCFLAQLCVSLIKASVVHSAAHVAIPAFGVGCINNALGLGNFIGRSVKKEEQPVGF